VLLRCPRCHCIAVGEAEREFARHDPSCLHALLPAVMFFTVGKPQPSCLLARARWAEMPAMISDEMLMPRPGACRRAYARLLSDRGGRPVGRYCRSAWGAMPGGEVAGYCYKRKER
jgi:hypothetical protein